MPRIAGRLVGFLMIHEGAYTLDDLAEALQASKASVSTNARLLEERGILLRTSSPGDRRDFYEIAPAPWQNFITNAQRKVQKFSDVVTDTIKALPPEEVAARRRLREAALFYKFLLEQLGEHKERFAELMREAEQNGLLDDVPVSSSVNSKDES